MLDASSLAGKLLVAMPAHQGDCFEKAIILLLEHSQSGAFGLIINQPDQLTEGDIIHSVLDAYDADAFKQTAFIGGPVHAEQGFIIHPSSPTTRWQAEAQYDFGISVTTSSDILTAIAEANYSAHYLIALGYAGWDQGQLEQELQDNHWLVAETQPQRLFAMSWSKRYDFCLNELGISAAHLSAMSGQA
ncbi:MAG: YqgE/AlgH family protein [Pseudomonadales bacterium]|nr:YqgE/AlgH family protein [Pseudomonadales bacterium]